MKSEQSQHPLQSIGAETVTAQLEAMPANRAVVGALYAQGSITADAREYALNMLYPHNQWRQWIANMLLAVGTVLLLSGIVFFFAANWAEITPLVRFVSLQCGIVLCVIGVMCYSLQRLGGQIWLLSASVIVGVFLAVFGQIYQTGADSYQLFLIWSLLTFGWTMLSCFAAQWLFWLIITNVSLVLWWQQAALPTGEMEFLLFIYLTLYNGVALLLREIYAPKAAYAWLAGRWTRTVLTMVTLCVMLIPILAWIDKAHNATSSIIFSSIVGLTGHVVLYYVYRHKMLDMLSLTAIVFSVLMMGIAASQRFFEKGLRLTDTNGIFAMGVVILTLFTVALIYLRKVAAQEGNRHV